MDRFEQEAMDLEADIIRNLSERAAPRIAAWGRRCYAEGRAQAFEEVARRECGAGLLKPPSRGG